MPEDQSLKVALPESLRAQFGRLEKRAFRVEALLAAAVAALFLLGGFCVFFLAERFIEAPRWMRLALAGIPLLGCVLTGWFWLWRWVVRQRSLRDLAVIVQRRHRRLGDRLLGIVELADEHNRPAHFSPELYRAAIGQVSEESARYEFGEAVSSARARRNALAAVSLLAIAVIAALVLPQATWNAFRRWIAPLANVPRFTLVELSGLENELIVPHGEPFALTAKVEYRSFWRPGVAKGLLTGQPEIRARVDRDAATLNIPGQTRAGLLRIRVGDAERSVSIRPTHRPGLEAITAEVKLPEYLGYPNQEENLRGGGIEVVEGSVLTLRGQASRELRSAAMQAGEAVPVDLKVDAQRFSAEPLPADQLARAVLTWSDRLGLTNNAPFQLAIAQRPDSAPVPEIAGLFRDTAMLETEVLPIQVRARDDFGIKLLGLDWHVEGTETVTNQPALDHRFVFTAEDTAGQTIDATFNFSPAVLRIPADTTVEIRAYATDFLPGRERAETAAYRIHILGTAQHAEMVRQNLESLLVRLEEVTRLEERLAADTRELKDLAKLDTPEAAAKMRSLEKAQDQNAEQLRNLAEEGMKNLREALRNPAFSEELLKEWTQNLHQMEQVASQPMAQASQSLQNAQNSSSSEQKEKNLAEAVEKQEETIDQLQKMQKQVNQGLDDLQALTLSERLQKLGSEQKKIEGHLQKHIPETVGLTPPELPPRFQKVNSSLATLQTESQTESVKLQGEISRFYERTQKPNYGKVSQEMTETHPGDRLEEVRGLIQDNVGMEAMRNLALWADRFVAWAETLQPPQKSDESGGGEGGSPGGPPEDDSALKQLLALLRVRERQVNVQERTRLLHEHLEEVDTYRDGAVLLAASQAKLNRDLTKQAVENPFALLEAPYADAMTAMSDVENLLDRPRTDQVTRSAQDKSLAMLTDLINLLNEQAKKGASSSGQGQSSQSGEMAFLMQMMAPQMMPGMKAGQTPGGNMAGGTTDRASGPAAGNAAGAVGEGRTVNKASGVPGNYPTEFRPALERYFKALEEAQK